MIKHFTNEDNFQNEVSEGLVLVDFYATWCGPCSMLAPEIEKLDKETKIKVIKIDTDEFPEIARGFRIMSIPTLLLFKEGKLVSKTLGYMPLSELKKFVNQ